MNEEISSQSNNKRIAKNTLFLYLRMIFTMFVNLYTSRIILKVLGISDFGLYNVIGGVVVMFTVVNFAMTCSTNRFLNYELGRNGKHNLSQIFSVSIILHWLIALLIILLGETIGLWFLYNKLTIPADRMDAAFWIYQFSIFTTILKVLTVPFDAVVMSFEKMGVFAAISIFETVMKLLIIIIVPFLPYDRLISYGFLIAALAILIRAIYQIYNNRKFSFIKFTKNIDRKKFKEMFAYAGWSLFGSTALMSVEQGLNLLLNVFYGPVLNAARGVSFQVQNAIKSFSSNIQRAVTPQLNQSFASGKMDYMHSLFYKTSKYSFLIIFGLGFPVIFFTDYILSLWLIKTPEYSGVFIKLLLFIAMFDSLSDPLSNAVGATGKIKLYQIIQSMLNLLVLPCSYFLLKFGFAPSTVFFVQLFICIVKIIPEFIIVKRLINLQFTLYFKNVILPIVAVLLVSGLFGEILKSLFQNTLISFIVLAILMYISVIIVIFILALDNNEKRIVIGKINILYAKFFTKK